MPKEMIVSCSSHETKIAILEDDQVAEVYFEREKEYTLAGSIYKGRVTRVLPGMQSAFVNIGLERDAFLYVSDFLEDTEEYDRIASTVEEKVIRMEENVPVAEATVAPAISMESAPGEVAPGPPAEAVAPAISTPIAQPPETGAAPPPQGHQRYQERGYGGEGHGRFSRRGRRRRGHHRGFPESKYARTSSAPSPAPVASAPSPVEPPASAPIILPGESLAKYREWPQPEPGSQETELHEGAVRQNPTAISEEESANESVASASGRVEVESEVTESHPGDWNRLEFANEPGESQEREASLGDDREAVEHAASLHTDELTEEEERAEPFSYEAQQQPVEQERIFDQAGEEPETRDDIPGEEVNGEAETRDDAPAPEAVSFEASNESSEAAAHEQSSSGEPSGSPAELPMSERAAVRERYRNPRYTRKARWAARRENRGEAQGRGGGIRPRERQAPPALIADLLKEGQEIIVQIAKEPLGKKGARITSHIALPGRYLVYMPTVDHVGVSRKIGSEEERQRLKRIILEHSKNIPGGFIVRTAGEGHSEEDFRQDIQYLSKLWAEIRTQAEKSSAPTLLHHDLNLVLRTLRDQLSEEFSAVWVDNEQEYERILSLVSKFQPALVNRVKLYTKDVPLFDEMGIQEEINKALKPKVWLKSGGYIVINQTEALVAIDVNTGKYVGKSNRLEDTIVKTNIDAVKEIVRQIRLRDLGGIIVVDFIDMDEKKNRQKVMAAMEEALKHDRAPSKLLSFNEFGLVAITRKRVRQSLERTLCQPCSTCGGSGLVKSVTSVCYEI